MTALIEIVELLIGVLVMAAIAAVVGVAIILLCCLAVLFKDPGSGEDVQAP